MKFVTLLAAAYVNGALRQPSEGALHLSNEEAKRLIDGGLATDVTDDFSAAQDEDTPAETVSAPGGGKSPTSKADEDAPDTKDKAKG